MSYPGDDHDLSADVAIIGMSCRFPGADGVDEFWSNLCAGTESIETFTIDELVEAGNARELVSEPTYVRARGSIQHADCFDAPLFGVSPGEAELTDPQHRVFLECAWAALEHAGYAPGAVESLIGVYAGAGMNTYILNNLVPHTGLVDSAPGARIVVGNDKDHLSTYVSYKLNLKGPSVGIQTACSTSLSAVHLACQSVLGGECDLALAGGVSILTPLKTGYQYQEGGILSADGHCRAFDRSSGGAVGGDGAGIVVLKRLEAAIEDRDYIHAVIRGSAINNDGSLKAGYTAPSVTGQAQVIRMAHQVAETPPDTITYVEAHGTGTRLGDPIEVAALTQAFRAGTDRTGFCTIGSVKTNIGHLDAAAGVAGLIKTTLAIENGQIPPSLHYREPNPEIDFATSPFVVKSSLSDWETKGAPRRAGVSSFGMGGTNVHLVLEEAPQVPARTSGRSANLLTVSAQSAEVLHEAVENLARHLEANPSLELADIAYTLHVGRRDMPHRLAVVCESVAEASSLLRRAVARSTGAPATDNPSTCFVFGGRRPPEGGAAFSREPAFLAAVEDCRQLLERILGTGLHEQWLAQPTEAMADAATFSTEFALAKLWMNWGITPGALFGVGLGEYVAACLAGVLSLADALRLTSARSRILIAGVESDGAVAAFREQLSRSTFQEPQIPYVAGSTGDWISRDQAMDPEYWFGRAGQDVAAEKGLRAFLHTTDGPVLDFRQANVSAGIDVEHPDGSTARIVVAPLRVGADEALSQLWSAGMEIDWGRFHSDGTRNRVPLPTYPFERNRYWIDAPSSDDQVADTGGVRKRKDSSAWFYVPSWRRMAPARPAEDIDSVPGRWMVFCEPGGVGDLVADALSARGASVSKVFVSRAESVLPVAGVQHIDPVKPQSFVDLFDAWSDAEPGEELHIIHAWGVDVAVSNAAPKLSSQEWNVGLLSVLNLAQAVGAAGAGRPGDLTVLTVGAVDVSGDDELSPSSASMLGACASLPQEISDFHTYVVDLPRRQIDDRTPELVGQLVDEICADERESIVALRGQHRWTRAFEPIRLDRLQPELTLRDGGAYFVIGGLGGVGYETAQFLAESCRPKLALCGRTALPSKESWNQWIAEHGVDDGVSRHISRLRKLESLGADVQYLTADASDTASLRSAIEQAEKRLGPLNGLVFAAGAPKTAHWVETARPADWHEQLHSKVNGLESLHEALGGRSLDFCLLQSSLSAELGASGFAAYAAAHSFMDAFAQQRNRLDSFPWIYIDWDNWLNWKEPIAGGELYLTRDEGREALARILSQPSLSAVLVSVAPIDARRFDAASDKEDAVGPGPSRRLHDRPDVDADFVPAATNVERTLARIWAENLGFAEVGMHDNYFELGGDSVLGLSILAEAKREGIHLTPDQLFEQQTIQQLAVVAQVSTSSFEVLDDEAGRLRLTPMQAWFLEQGYPRPNHFNLPAMFSIRGPLQLDKLQAGLHEVAQRHEALRLRLGELGTDERQTLRVDRAMPPVVVLDLAGFSKSERTIRLEQEITEMQSSLDLERGPISRVAVIKGLDGDSNRLVWVAHHLAVDIYSWRVLIDDLESTYARLRGNQPAGDVGQPASFRQASNALWRYAQSDVAKAELGHWLTLGTSERQRLPRDFSDGANTVSSEALVELAFAEDETSYLLVDPSKAYGMSPEEVIVAALAVTLAKQTGADDLLIEMETEPRARLPEPLDLSSAVGWLTMRFPAKISLTQGSPERDVLRLVKDQLRSVPNGGISYSALRYLCDDPKVRLSLGELPSPEVSFAYLGGGAASTSERVFGPRELELAGPLCDPSIPRGRVLRVLAAITDGLLRVKWAYSGAIHQPETISAWADEFAVTLRSFISHCRDQNSRQYSPSDFPDLALDQAGLDRLIDKIE